MPQNTSPTPDQPSRWVISKFGPPSVLQWDVFDPLPVPSHGELLIRIIVGGIAQADTFQRFGAFPDPGLKSPGFTPGYDFGGKVEKLGPDVTGFEVGDLVLSLCMIGAYATHIVLPAADAIKLQADDDIVKAAALPLDYMSAFGMLKRTEAKVGPGSSILVGSASGGVGTALALIVKAFDLDITMYGLCSPGKFDYVKSLGMTPIDRHAPNIPALVRDLNGGKGVDVSFDAAGSKASLDFSLEATEGSAGQVIAIGGLSLLAPDGSGVIDTGDFDVFAYVAQHPNMAFFGISPHYFRAQRDLFNSDFHAVLDKVRSGKLDPVLGKVWRLEQAVPVNEALASGVGLKGKMAFLVDAELAAAHGL
ncbi:hypothetical protein MMC29_003572 [Sticta canariensis]|nr:hypothetical protein [Sticta canariensis]